MSARPLFAALHARGHVLHDGDAGEHVDLGGHAEHQRQLEMRPGVHVRVDQAWQQGAALAPSTIVAPAGALPRKSDPRSRRRAPARIAVLVGALAVEDAHVADQCRGSECGQRRSKGSGKQQWFEHFLLPVVWWEKYLAMGICPPEQKAINPA
jgi:hypothetical protein